MTPRGAACPPYSRLQEVASLRALSFLSAIFGVHLRTECWRMGAADGRWQRSRSFGVGSPTWRFHPGCRDAVARESGRVRPIWRSRWESVYERWWFRRWLQETLTSRCSWSLWSYSSSRIDLICGTTPYTCSIPITLIRKRNGSFLSESGLPSARYRRENAGRVDGEFRQLLLVTAGSRICGEIPGRAWGILPGNRMGIGTKQWNSAG